MQVLISIEQKTKLWMNRSILGYISTFSSENCNIYIRAAPASIVTELRTALIYRVLSVYGPRKNLKSFRRFLHPGIEKITGKYLYTKQHPPWRNYLKPQIDQDKPKKYIVNYVARRVRCVSI